MTSTRLSIIYALMATMAPALMQGVVQSLVPPQTSTRHSRPTGLRLSAIAGRNRRYVASSMIPTSRGTRCLASANSEDGEVSDSLSDRGDAEAEGVDSSRTSEASSPREGGRSTAVVCPECDLCDGSGRIAGGLGAVLPWLPVKAYRPCPNFVNRGGTYQRSGQGLDEIAFGRDSTYQK
jgi:hypothetical protein